LALVRRRGFDGTEITPTKSGKYANRRIFTAGVDKNMAAPAPGSLILYLPWFSITPSATTYQFQISDLDTVDSHVYDYKLDVSADLNTILSAFKVQRIIEDAEVAGDPPLNTMKIIGEADAWASLHKLLSAGTGDALATFLTTMHDTNETDSRSWDTFWSGLLSECVDPDDKNGMSVNMTKVKAVIDYPTNSGVSVNDITGSINDALGAVNTVGLVSESNAWGTQVFGSPVDAQKNFFVALAVYLEREYGAFDGSEGSLSGDPNLAPVTFAMKAGTGFALRISCTITVAGVATTRYGRIQLLQR
jgi:hypothetical protein